MNTTQWWAEVTMPSAPEAITDDQHDELAAANRPGWAVVRLSPSAVVFEMTVDADTLTEAATAAVVTAEDAYARAFAPAAAAGVRIISAEARDAEAAHPAPVDVVGLADIADMLGVNRQRAAQLAARDDFPAPLGHIRTGPVYSRASIDAFEHGWDRAVGRPRKH